MLSEKNTETHKRLKVNKRITAVFKHDNLLVKLISLSKVIYISTGACSAGQTSILSSIYRFTNSFTYTDFFSKLIAPDKILKRMLSPQREQITNSCWPPTACSALSLSRSRPDHRKHSSSGTAERISPHYSAAEVQSDGCFGTVGPACVRQVPGV